MSVSLRALKALVETARAGSAAAAAHRMGISASAISHSLSELEAQLGAPLFADRRRAQLNEKGQQLVRQLEPAFQNIDLAVDAFRTAHSAIRLSTLSSFAMLWLIPRLPRLRQRLPAVDILISTDTRLVDLATEPYDCVIRWVGERADWRGLEHHLLFHEQLIQVASPRLSGPALPRLMAKSRPGDAALFSQSPASASGGTMFDTRGQMIEAAIAGLGIAIIDRHLVSRALAAGHLVQIGDQTLDRPEGYAFAARPTAMEDHNLRLFRTWLLEEAGRE